MLHLQSHPQPVPVNSQRIALLSRSNLDESFGFALQTYIFKRGPVGLTERITYVDYVREDSAAAVAGVRRGDVVVAVNGFPVLAESHKALVDLMSSQLKLHLVLLYQDITRILALSVRSLQLQYILAEKYILLEQMDMEEASLLHGSGGSLSTDFRRARWLSACQDISKSLNLCRKLLGRESKQDLYRLHDAPAESAGVLTALEHNVELDDDCSQKINWRLQKMFARSCLPPSLFTRQRDFGLNHLVYAVTSNGSPQTRMTSSGPPPVAPPKPGSFSDRYDKFISRWPKVHALHRMVVDGSRWCFSDIKVYFRIKRELSAKKKELTDLTMEELEVLIQVRVVSLHQ
ncbi:hypothetical protein ANCCAN_24280 [Ancylostoma caninum]|uniref:PDZ domain-containing protein n=1 Tax=Ancylostoma caninum TaxID=29170 RepID=A0A368FCV5_ANCCA|nr:hypothetical protein ANCCAN_24280 [Ancylostoma caninum]